MLTYGLPDFSALNVTSPADQNRLRQMIETTIRTFEPRLIGVTAILQPASETERSVFLRLEARLVMDPAPEAVSFDIVMPMTTLKYEVKEPT